MVQGSFRKVLPVAGLAADTFYDHLFEVAPDLRRRFPRDMAEQKDALLRMLAVAVNGLPGLVDTRSALEALGRRHAGYGVEAAHYDPFGTALLHALRMGLGRDFTPEVQAAWAETYGLLVGVMIGAQHEAD